MSEHVIGTIDDFPKNQGTRVEVNGIGIAVINVEGELYAVTDLCPHKRYPLHRVGHQKNTSEARGDPSETFGYIDVEECSIRCEWHLMEWNLETGVNPVTKEKISTFGVDVDEDGKVTLEI